MYNARAQPLFSSLNLFFSCRCRRPVNQQLKNKMYTKSHFFIAKNHETWHVVGLCMVRFCLILFSPPFGHHQEKRPLGRSNSLSMGREIVSYSQPIKFVRLTLSIRESWCYRNGARPLGTRMVWFHFQFTVIFWLCHVFICYNKHLFK